MSSMSSLTTALSALHAQRKGLDTTGHNIANANTVGYTRQRVDLASRSGVGATVWSSVSGTGQGVDVAGTKRLNDAFLDLRSNQEHSLQGNLLVNQSVLGRIELAFGEPSELGLASQLNDYWASWDDVANHPTDMAARQALLERASTLSGNLRGTAQSLDALRTDFFAQMQGQVTAANQTATAIAQLNNDIADASNAGLSANDLMDRRDLLVSELADLLGATTRPGGNGTIDVFVGGTALVRGFSAESMEVVVGGSPPVAEVQWSKDGYPADIAGGSMAGLLTATNDTIPSYLSQLDAVAVRLVELTNAMHTTGVDLQGAAGTALFTGTGAADITVAITDPERLAAAAPGGGTADGSNALALAALAGHKGVAGGVPPFDTDGPDLAYRKMIVGLGVQTDAVNRRVDIQSEITRQVDAARDSQAGVNLDEEMTNMLAYQRAYEAASRFLTTIDQTLDRLINATGVVGR